MPLYQYVCRKCEKQFEIEETIGLHAQHRQHQCPRCGSSEVQQVISNVTVQTKRKA
ncbi:MAG: zinc ribbon domain-containing protein [Planctomycetaceae bacterium]|nr:zinc ribbon domain-containing protein [Planctomycetaceae bacterium]